MNAGAQACGRALMLFLPADTRRPEAADAMVCAALAVQAWGRFDVHIDGRPRRKDEPGGETAAGYLRSFLPIPADCQPLCAVAAGYSDFTPAPLPGSDDDARIIRLE